MSAEVGGGNEAKSEPNVVPLCDILLVLLIIFMVVTPMIQRGANVLLPEAKNTMDQPEPGQMITVYIKKNKGGVYLDDKLVDDITKLGDMITDKMEELQKTEKKVLLKADIEVEYGDVVDVMNQIKNAQIEVIGLVTEKQTSGVE
jgi:biopolymer transport protein TolR